MVNGGGRYLWWDVISGPDGAPLCEPIPHDEEGILSADASFDAIGVATTTADAAGHCAGPDVARLLLNTAPARRVVPMGGSERSETGSCPDGSGGASEDPRDREGRLCEGPSFA